MYKMLSGLLSGAVCLSLAIISGASLADAPRGTVASPRGRGTTSTVRMPSLPILPVSATGNMTLGTDEVTPTPTPNPNPNPNPEPNPTPTPDIPVDQDCPDGGIRNSSYTVDDCMNDILGCVNGGALPNGINSLFNEELRNSIINGMGLCLTQAENCVATVRQDCHNVYASVPDVWLDFNARRVQPEYYRFVLAQTGLTPTQAENTCLLLDRNTFGASFDAVSASNRTTSEYNQQVGAYNGQMNNSLTKANPMGAQINNTGLNGNRGYYARWDAENAQCLLRVAAYNKDTFIKNSWLFGTIGDDNPAEVWQAAGSTFTCNKDLFGFSLMNDTKTTAVVGIGGGTLVGAGIGAMAGHGDRSFSCSDKTMREELLKQVQDGDKVGSLNQYLDEEEQISIVDKTLSQSQCDTIAELYDLWAMGKEAVKNCQMKESGLTNLGFKVKVSYIRQILIGACGDADACPASLTEEDINNLANKITDEIGNQIKAYLGPVKEAIDACSFLELNVARRDGTGVYCNGTGAYCIPREEFESELAELTKVFNTMEILAGEKSNRLKTTLIGAGVGAGVGGTATAITAFVERNNINCRVADGLAKVGFGKSYSIDRLRDFYVKWALNLPAVAAPTATVTNCANWQLTCNLYSDPTECNSATFNYRPGNISSMTSVPNACKTSGSACVVNLPVAQSKGECLATPVAPDNPIPSVNNCTEWDAACAVFANAKDCNDAKVIYVPKSMQISTACKYNQNAKKCGVNNQKAKQYMNGAECQVSDR